MLFIPADLQALFGYKLIMMWYNTTTAEAHAIAGLSGASSAIRILSQQRTEFPLMLKDLTDWWSSPSLVKGINWKKNEKEKQEKEKKRREAAKLREDPKKLW